VTLVGQEGIDDNHANIMIEGIANDSSIPRKQKNGKNLSGQIKPGEHFVVITDYSPDIRIKEVDFAVYDGAQRTKVWMVSAEKVKAMLKEISLETDETRNFHLFGRESIVVIPRVEGFSYSENKDSCITWAKEKLHSIGITLEENPCRYLLSATKLYTKNPEKFNLEKVQISI
jgi:hypothetical protein